MNNVWRFTGNPENWITAIRIKKWALNEHNKPKWVDQIKSGDTVIFHSTKISDYTNTAVPSVIGFGYIGENKYEKDELWWIQEINEKENKWPYVVPFKEIYLFSDISKLDLNTSIDKKSKEQILDEIKYLTSNSLPIGLLNKEALGINPDCPKFPVNGSVSRINKVYEYLILEQKKDFFIEHDNENIEVLENKLSKNIDEKLSALSKEEILKQANNFDNSEAESHAISYGRKKVRKENQVQKRRAAKIEDYSCQICGYKYEYGKSNGKKAWIIHIDHIMDKAEGHNENLNNLFALCPNCHAKKTAGVITVDLKKKKVFENDKEIKLHHDNHLFLDSHVNNKNN